MKTIGIVLVASLAASAGWVGLATIRSTGRPMSSAARRGSGSALPSEKRQSMARVFPPPPARGAGACGGGGEPGGGGRGGRAVGPPPQPAALWVGRAPHAADKSKPPPRRRKNQGIRAPSLDPLNDPPPRGSSAD